MNHNKTHIDSILQELDKHTIASSAESKAKFLGKAAKFSFFRFYVGRFNIYYLIITIAITVGTIVILQNNNSHSEAKYNANHLETSTYQSLENSQTNLPEIVFIKDSPQNTENLKTTEINKDEIQTKIEHPNKTQSSQDKIITTPDESSSNTIEQTSGNTIINQQQGNNPTVIDTVEVVKTVQVIDTIQTEIKDTVKIKQNTRRRRR